MQGGNGVGWLGGAGADNDRRRKARAAVMKRSDAFMLIVTAFIAVNCGSYFVYSGVPHVTGWGIPAFGCEFEEIGFPFRFHIVAHGCITSHSSWSWTALLGDLGVALLAAWVFSGSLATRLPPLWEEHECTLQYSLGGLLRLIAAFAVALGVGTANPACGLVVRNLLCFAGPLVAFAWCSRCWRLGWARLAIAALSLSVVAIGLGFRYEDPRIDGHTLLAAYGPHESLAAAVDSNVYLPCYLRHVIARTFVRAMVPVFGLMSLVMLLHTAREVLRPDWRAIWRWIRTAGTPLDSREP